MPQSRQLAAIMFTDIVGYTALMGEDERKAYELLKKNRWLQRTLIEEYGGRWIKELGDGVLASFSNVMDAVSCACLLIKGCSEIEGLQLRIGIHLGDVIFENNDVFGDSVNIASRIQALAPVGGIWISEPVHKNIINKKGINSTYVREENLKNVKEPVRIYEVDINSFHIEGSEEVEKKIDLPHPSIDTKGKKKNLNYRKVIAWGIPVIALGLLAAFMVPPILKKQTARKKLIPEIQKLVDDNFAMILPTKAFDLAKEAEKYIPNDSALIKVWPAIAQNFSFETIPAGADVYWKDYNDVTGTWKHIGKTPLKDIWFPRGFPRVKIEKSGFKTIYSPTIRTLKLDSIGTYPDDMVKVVGSKARMLIVGLEQHGGKDVGDFLIDKYEVTNKDFKRFVDADGYRDKKYWDYTFVSDHETSWEKMMGLFVDKTGRPGPATWEAGTYPDGKESHPVSGISWYEAMAYAKFAGKKIPSVYHWSLVANTLNTWGIIPKSNFNGIGTVPVGSLEGISNWGVYDIAGNVREWCINESNKKGQRFILGGGWNDPTYAFNDGYIQSVLDRSMGNGFRCMKELQGDSTMEKLVGKVEFAFRNYNDEKPVNDETLKVFLRQYYYDHSPLKPDVKMVADSGLWKIEKIDIDAAYNKERLTAYLYLPRNFSPPYQTVVFFPGSNAIYLKKFNYNQITTSFDHILKSGRSVLYPVLKGTFERGGELHSDLQEETKFYKDHVIYWVQDISRSLDYLETRKDIEHSKFGYYGFSWGSAMGGIVCAVETRFKTAVYHLGGLMMQKTFPEVDPLNFLSRVKIPVLILNGKNDTFFPHETSQLPMFKLLGTAEKDKKLILYEGGHVVPKSELIKESLMWFDKYLGPVK